jgi:hypothetical protein
LAPPKIVGVAGRCHDVDVDGGQCQLQFGHQSVHAAAVEDAFLTWEDGEVFRWSARTPPGWLIGLYWMPAFQPIMPDTPPLPLF